MIRQIDFTYNRFPRLPPSRTPDFGETQAVKDKGGSPARKKDSKETPGDRRTWLQDMVERLNKQAHLFDSKLSFRTEGKKQPNIEMVDQAEGKVLGRYGVDDLIDLERSLHDLAGLRLSIEA